MPFCHLWLKCDTPSANHAGINFSFPIPPEVPKEESAENAMQV